MHIKSILLTAALGAACFCGQAQEQRDLKKEVKVRTNYKPEIKKAKRIGELPTIVDTVTFTKRFDYSIRSKSLDVSFKPGSIKAVGMTAESLKKTQGHSFDLAAGNYSSLFADYAYNNLQSESTDFGVHLQHYSTNGKLELEDGDKVKPDWKEFLAELYGSHYLDEAKISSRFFYKHKAFNYYGFPQAGDVSSDKTNLLDYDSQRYNHFGLKTSYETLVKDPEQLNFNLGVDIEYFTDKIKLNEIEVGVKGKAEVKRGNGLWALAGSINYLQTNDLVYWDGSMKNKDVKSSLLSFNPSYTLSFGGFNMRLGTKAQGVLGDDSDFRMFPDVKIDIVLADHILNLFAGLDGNLDLNSARSITNENPFVQSGLNVKSTSTNYRVYGGLKNKIGAQSSSMISVEYADIDQQYFFSMANDAFSPDNALPQQLYYFNKYAVVYDDLYKMSITGEVDLQVNKELNLYALAKYTHYSLDKIEEAWQLPNFEMETRANYRFTDQWLFKARLVLLGERPVMTNGLSAQLDVLADFGLGAEYKWNDLLSLYANVNNIFDADAYLWQGYPSQGINGMIGLKLVF